MSAEAFFNELCEAIEAMERDRNLKPRLIVVTPESIFPMLAHRDYSLNGTVTVVPKTLLGFPWAEAERPMRKSFNLLPVGKQTCECWGTGEERSGKPCWRCEGRGWRL